MRLAAISAATSCLLLSLGCHYHRDTVHEGAEIRVVARFDRLLTAVAVSSDGRVFVNHPHWFSRPTDMVLELHRGGRRTPYPNTAWNRWNGDSGDAAARAFVSVQSVYVDRGGRTLWILDPANPVKVLRGVVAGGAKLVQVDLLTDRVTRIYNFDEKLAPKDSYLNDVRVDRTRGVAYITDSGMGALLVLDLKTGTARRVLNAHFSTRAEPGVVPRVGGRAWRAAWKSPKVHVDGLALDPDGEYLYYHAVSGRTLYRIRTEVLRGTDDAAMGAAVENLGQTSAVDGMWMGRDGSLYLTSIERDAIERRGPDGKITTVVADPYIRWPDSIAVADYQDGTWLLFTTSSIHLTAPFNGAHSSTEPFYSLMAVRIAGPPR